MSKQYKDIKVSVFIMTYNQKAYIKDALEGALNQKTNFKYEIIVHDDASTDGTTEIVMEYEQHHPDKIIALYEDINTYSHYWDTTKKMEEQAHGKYIANCDGDDYWTDENKLQIQYNFMESHPDYFACVHNSQVLDTKSGQTSLYANHKTGELLSGYVIENAGACFHTSSWFFRNNHDGKNLGDLTRVCYMANSGKIMYFDKCMSVYRLYTKNSWSEGITDKFGIISDYMQRLINYENFDKETNYVWHENVENISTRIKFQVYLKMRTLYRQFKFKHRFMLLLTMCLDCFGLYPLREKIRTKFHI